MALFKVREYGLNTFILVSAKAYYILRDMVRLHIRGGDCTCVASGVFRAFRVFEGVYEARRLPEGPLHASYFIVYCGWVD